MKKVLTLILLMFIVTNCTERMTKQFVNENLDSDKDSKIVENWIINPPNLIAYKNMKAHQIKEIPDLFWLTIRSNSIKNMKGSNTLKIDSVGLEFVNQDTTLWRTPTRVVPYKESKKEKYLAFDFFKDEGVQIPDSVLQIRLFFDAIILDTLTNTQTSHPVTFDMTREVTIQMTPFMIQ